MHGLLPGRTPIGERVWDMSRLLDWALENLAIDSRRIAITGNSGGGTVSLFAAACDTRFGVAVPGSYLNTFTGSIGSIRHCDCNYIPGILRLGEMYDVAGLIAPRPFCAIAGEADPIYPIEKARYAYKKLRQIYCRCRRRRRLPALCRGRWAPLLQGRRLALHPGAVWAASKRVDRPCVTGLSNRCSVFVKLLSLSYDIHNSKPVINLLEDG